MGLKAYVPGLRSEASTDVALHLAFCEFAAGQMKWLIHRTA